MRMRGLITTLALIPAFFGTVSCGLAVPFEITTATNSISIPTTASVYLETTVPVPSQAQDSKLTFDEITVYYSATKGNNFSAKVALYATDKSAADNVKGSPETLASLDMGITDTSASGSTVSVTLKNKLNTHPAAIVLGGENMVVGLTGSVAMNVWVKVKGSYRVF